MMNRYSWPSSESSQKQFHIIIYFVLLFFISGVLLWKSMQIENMDPIKSNSKPRPYYFQNGTVYPKPATFSKELGKRNAKLLPLEDPDNDRVENQLMFVPPNYDQIRKSNKTKSIVFYNGIETWWHVDINKPQTFFSDKKCPVSTCTLLNNTITKDAEKADFIMFHDQFLPVNLTRMPNQIYGFFSLKTPSSGYPRSLIYNWTITYRHDSTIVIPYSKWAYYNPKVKQIPQTINYAANKTKKVAWIVSDCDNIQYNDHLDIGYAIQKYIQVDIYGKCGTLNCTSMDECLSMIGRDYKFYLAFENLNCADYITEKLYRNALEHNMLPIVMGARREDYERQAPHESYIFMEDFSSPKALADYLHKLDKDDDLYNSYFKWKGTGELLDGMTNFWCRLCAILHDDYITSPRWYNDINEWWFDEKLWRRGLWRDSTK